ncbi:hypothetical protein K438DRAFT_1937948 [Mycena galopus ATCC 62051]|nr:hypothetical protein K438DRAFT_1937948 [Mycena galopus ATCC 62051]
MLLPQARPRERCVLRRSGRRALIEAPAYSLLPFVPLPACLHILTLAIEWDSGMLEYGQEGGRWGRGKWRGMSVTMRSSWWKLEWGGRCVFWRCGSRHETTTSHSSFSHRRRSRWMPPPLKPRPRHRNRYRRTTTAAATMYDRESDTTADLCSSYQQRETRAHHHRAAYAGRPRASPSGRAQRCAWRLRSPPARALGQEHVDGDDKSASGGGMRVRRRLSATATASASSGVRASAVTAATGPIPNAPAPPPTGKALLLAANVLDTSHDVDATKSGTSNDVYLRVNPPAACTRPRAPSARVTVPACFRCCGSTGI